MPLRPSDDNTQIDLAKQDKIAFINRAPRKSDPGNFYVEYADTSTTMKLWVRHPKSGEFQQV